MSETVKVVVRARPSNQKERERGCKEIVEVHPETHSLSVGKEGDNNMPKRFTFDNVYGGDARQENIYSEVAFSLVESVLGGYNGTVFAYGQTGCGKTHTMEGKRDDPEHMGIIPRAFKHIFNFIDERSGNVTYLVRCSYIEIYMEQIRDLLGENATEKKDLKENEKGEVFVRNITNLVVKSANEIYKIMEKGSKNRTTAYTDMNADSSRSHSLFMIHIESEETVNGKSMFKVGKLNLVDLAGSERQSKTRAEGTRLEEAKMINLSLTALGNVISCLVDGKSSHIPYRDSKLTRLLQDSLGGNTKTVMIAACSPVDYNYDETISTLRYADRAKKIKNKPIINEDPKDALLRQYQEEINKLKEMLQNPEAMKEYIQSSPSKLSKGSKGDDRVHVEQFEKEKEKILREKENLKQVAETEKERAENIKLEMQSKLEVMQKELIKGGEAIKEKEREKEHEKYQLMKKLHDQKEKEDQLIREKLKKNEELKLMEENYKNAEDELNGLRLKVKKLQHDVRMYKTELEDINKENEYEREQLLDAIRENDKQLDFYKQIVEIALGEEEIQVIKRKSKYDEMEHRFKIPNFVLRNQKVVLPKIGQAQFNELKGGEIEGREVDFNEDKVYDMRASRYDNKYSNGSMHNVHGAFSNGNNKGTPHSGGAKYIKSKSKAKLHENIDEMYVNNDYHQHKTENSFNEERAANKDLKQREKQKIQNRVGNVKLEPMRHQAEIKDDPLAALNKINIHNDNRKLPPMDY